VLAQNKLFYRRFTRKTLNYADQYQYHDGPQHGKEQVKNQDKELKSGPETDRVDVTRPRNDF